MHYPLRLLLSAPPSVRLQPLQPETFAYVAAVEAQDGQALEPSVVTALDAFVVGCKRDNIWNAIKASCILAGARTLNGALVPLVGTAPTNFNFVSGDYNRKTGLVGNATTKYLDTNRACSSESVNNVHASVYVNTRDVGTGRYIGAVTTSPIFELIGNATGFRARVNTGTINTHGTLTTVPAIIGVSRSASASYNWRNGSESGSQATVSTGISTGNYAVFATNTGTTVSNARLAFYSIGESLDLALLDARVTDLINAFAAAIP